MTPPRFISFETDHLLGKWGFADGELLSSFLRNNGFDGIDPESEEWYQFCRRVLCEVVELYVLPEIENEIKPYRLSSPHNPIRVYEVDGVHQSDWEDKPILRPLSVEVPVESVLEWASALFEVLQDERGEPVSYTVRSSRARDLMKARGWE